ncbi:MAG: Tol-Pal system beta propeller repeat protein TolB [Pseudomonadota bacterium]|nr:Tol-Pal system beta propeller repeat protein TolB [Pseudomonadota bacterium]
MNRWLLGCFLFVCAFVQVQAQSEIVINQGQQSALGIAYVDFDVSAAGGEFAEFNRILERELQLTHEFAPVRSAALLSTPTLGESIAWGDFKSKNLPFLLRGAIQLTASGQQRYTYELWNVLTQEPLIKEDYQSDHHVRRMAQTISDEIYEAILGIPGVASTKILYVTSVKTASGFEFHLNIADSHGEFPQPLVTSEKPILSPTWSPDGSRFAYASYSQNKAVVFIQDLLTGVRQELPAFDGINGAPSWSPDGQYLAMTLSKDGNPEIYAYHIRSGTHQRLTVDSAIDTEPSWFPDGRGLLFTSDRGGSPQLYRLDLASKKVTRLTFDGKYNAKGQVTPDGRYIVFVHGKSGQYHIAVKGVDRPLFKLLTQTPLDESPSISPNGLFIAYATRNRGQNTLAFLALRNGKINYVPTQKAIREPAWSPFLNF